MPELQDNTFTTIGSANIGATRITRTLAKTELLADNLRELEAGVRDYVRIQRAVQVPPESILAQAKRLVSDSLPLRTPVETRNTIMKRVIEWYLDACYGEPRVDPPIEVERPEA